jgi:hypothetical protein
MVSSSTAFFLSSAMLPHDLPHVSQPPQSTTSSLASALGSESPLVIRPDYEPLRKKDGTLSKIRSHRGNIPVLPQTKLCPHCPAKFTRTTHLNRHLRNRKDCPFDELDNNTYGRAAQIQMSDFIVATCVAVFGSTPTVC